MLPRTHGRALLPSFIHPRARLLENAHWELGWRARVEAFDGGYELGVRIPRAATRDANTAKEA